MTTAKKSYRDILLKEPSRYNTFQYMTPFSPMTVSAEYLAPRVKEVGHFPPRAFPLGGTIYDFHNGRQVRQPSSLEPKLEFEQDFLYKYIPVNPTFRFRVIFKHVLCNKLAVSVSRNSKPSKQSLCSRFSAEGIFNKEIV